MGIRLVKLAVIYWIIGMALGAYMGATNDFTYRPVHAHINLLGWASLCLTGLVFHAFPELAKAASAKIFFWLYNIAVPVTLVLLAAFYSGHPEVDPALGASSMLIVVAGALFAWTVLIRLRSQ